MYIYTHSSVVIVFRVYTLSVMNRNRGRADSWPVFFCAATTQPVRGGGQRTLRSQAGVLQASASATPPRRFAVQLGQLKRTVRQTQHTRHHGPYQDAGVRGRRQRVRWVHKRKFAQFNNDGRLVLTRVTSKEEKKRISENCVSKS